MAQTLIDFSDLFLKVYINDGTTEYMRVRNTDFSMAVYTSPQVIYIKRAGNTICQIDGAIDAVRYGASSFADMVSQLEAAIAAIPAEGGGGGGETRSFVIGKTTSSVSKGSAVVVQVWYWNGTSHQQDPSAGTISAYSLYGAVGSGKYVGCHKDIDTDKWYIIAAGCA